MTYIFSRSRYLVVPVYLLWETVGFAIVSHLWTRFSPQLQAQVVKRYLLRGAHRPSKSFT